MNNDQTLGSLRKIGACNEAREWVKEHGGTSQELWNDCQRGDWMAWWIAKNPKYNQTPEFYLASADCAELSLEYFEKEYPNDKRVRNCIKTIRAYARGRATREELKSAAYAAYAAAYAAADAADAAAYAAAYAAYAAARTKTLSKCADIFRKYFPEVE